MLLFPLPGRSERLPASRNWLAGSRCLSSEFLLSAQDYQPVSYTHLDMTTEAAVTKLMWALGQTEDPAQVRDIFDSNLAGEVTL